MATPEWVTDAEMELAQQFEEETGIKIDFQIVPGDQYYNVLMTKLNGGEGPDIFGRPVRLLRPGVSIQYRRKRNRSHRCPLGGVL